MKNEVSCGLWARITGKLNLDSKGNLVVHYGTD